MTPTNKAVTRDYFVEPIPEYGRQSHSIPVNSYVFMQTGEVVAYGMGGAPIAQANRMATLTRVNELMYERQMEYLEKTDLTYDYTGKPNETKIDLAFQMQETPFDKAWWPQGVLKTPPAPEQELDEYSSDIRKATLALRGQTRCGNIFGPEVKGNMFLFLVKTMVDTTCNEPEFLRRLRNVSSKRQRLANELSQYTPIWKCVLSPSLYCPLEERAYQVPIVKNGKFVKNQAGNGYVMSEVRYGPAKWVGFSKYSTANDLVDQLYSYHVDQTESDPDSYGHIELLLV